MATILVARGTDGIAHAPARLSRARARGSRAPAASCPRAPRGRHRRRSRCSRCRSAMPYLAIAARRVAAAGEAVRRRRGRSRARPSRCRARRRRTRTRRPGRSRRSFPPTAAARASALGALRADVEDQLVGAHVADVLGRRRRVGVLNSRATTTSTGSGTSAPRARIAAITARASPTSAGSARLLPIGEPSASRKVLAMPPPTISRSTFFARLCRTSSLVETLLPATIATSGRFGVGERLRDRVDLGGEQRARAGDRRELGDAVGGRLGAVRGAERVVDVDIAERRHLPRQRRVVLLLALVEAAVLEHDDLARRGRRRHPTQLVRERHARGRAARRGAPRPARASPRASARLRSAGRGARSPSPRRRRRAPSRCTASDARMRVSSGDAGRRRPAER